ncbi:MAG: FMN-binding protein [Ruminococcaceae bacterium]|nr:FMN-binding protein [Oscillospiraceae bacterium]
MKYIKSVIALTVICALVAVLLALTNSITKPLIEQNASAEANAALLIVHPDGGDFTQVDLSTYELPATVTEAYTASNGGYVIKLLTSGYGADMVLMCGIDANGVVTGATCLSSTETLGYEKTYGDSLTGKTVEDIDAVETISGATKTTAGYKNAVKDALNATIILGGGSVDIRSEAEILNDNLNEALPAGEGKFVSWFMVEALENVTAVYEAENGTGYVLVSGEEFIAIDKSGAVLTAVADDVKAVMEANAQLILNSSIEEIDITGYSDMPTHIKKAYKTASGNYVFDVEAKGFGINGDHYYNPSGKPIELKASATSDGKIIAVLTVAQYETDGIGSACADASFYTQFNDKTEADYGDIEAISGATITTNGYKTAVSKVFEAVKILEGVA